MKRTIRASLLKVFDYCVRTLVAIESITLFRRHKKSYESILVIKTMMMGDVLMVTPALAALRIAYPNAKIAILVGNWSSPVLLNNPNVDEIIAFDDNILVTRHIRRILRLVRSLRRRRFDFTVTFHRSRAMAAFSFLIHSPVRAGLTFQGSGSFHTISVESNPSVPKYPVDMNLDLIRALRLSTPARKPQIFLTEPEERESRARLQSLGCDQTTSPILFVPGGASNPSETVPERRWAPERFAEVADDIAKTLSAPVILLGGPNDEQVANKVCEEAHTPIINLVGKTTVRQAIAIIAQSRLVLTNDTSLLHVAVALGRPTIGLFGPTHGALRIPPADTRFAAIQSPAECSPCYANENAFPGCRLGNAICMGHIRTDFVASTVLSKLKKGQNDSPGQA